MFMPQRLNDCLEWEWEGIMELTMWEWEGMEANPDHLYVRLKARQCSVDD